MAAETQTFIDEVKAPTIITKAQAANATRAYIPFVGRIQRQASTWKQLMGDARSTEVNDAIRQLMVEGDQKFGALLRQTGEMQREMTDVIEAYRELEDWYLNRFKPAAQAAGYVV